MKNIEEKLLAKGLAKGVHFDNDTLEWADEKMKNEGMSLGTICNMIIGQWNDCCDPGTEIIA